MQTSARRARRPRQRHGDKRQVRRDRRPHAPGPVREQVAPFGPPQVHRSAIQQPARSAWAEPLPVATDQSESHDGSIDETAIANPAIVLDDPVPFSGSVDEVPAAASRLPEHPGSGATAPVDHAVIAQAKALAFDSLKHTAEDVARYAKIVAATEAAPDKRAEIHEQHGIADEPARRAMDQTMGQAFRIRPELKERYDYELARWQNWFRS